jgi:hypothetical protein
MSYEEWQAKRVKDEVKSFMKQLITEVLLLSFSSILVIVT